MIANTKPMLTIITDLLMIAGTCGSVVTSGVEKAGADSIPHSSLMISKIANANQLIAPLISQPAMSAAQDVLQDGQDDRGQQRQPVADPGGLQGAFGTLHFGGIPAGHQVAGAADGQEQGGDRGDDAGDPD